LVRDGGPDDSSHSAQRRQGVRTRAGRVRGPRGTAPRCQQDADGSVRGLPLSQRSVAARPRGTCHGARCCSACGVKLACVTATVRSRLLVSGTSLTVLLFCSHFFNDLFAGTLAALLPTLQLRFDASELLLAAFVATLSFSSSMLQPLFGAVADRVGRRVVAAAGVVTSSAILSLMGVMPSPWLLLPLLLFGGLGSAAFHPAGISLARSAATRNRGLAMGIFSAGGTFGMAMGPLVIGLFLINDWLHLSPWLMAPGLLFGMLIYLLVPPQPRDPAGRKSKFFDADLFKGPVGLLCLAGVLRSISWTAIINGAPLWLVNARGLGPTNATLFLTVTTFTISGA